MNVDTINKFMLSLFFIYLLLASSNLNLLLGCQTQRFLKNNLLVKHALLFFSIYILTFILNWYTPESIVVKEEDTKEGLTMIFSSKKYNYLLQSLFYSFIIYSVFLFSSKMELYYFIVFMFFLVFVFVMFLLYKVNLSELDMEKVMPNSLFIYKSTIIQNIKDVNESIEVKDKEMDNVVYLYNILTLSYMIIPVIIGVGVYKYYLKQKREKGVNFNFVKFLFGTNKCANI